jgi:stalled ribosome rescue protein Dom34
MSHEIGIWLDHKKAVIVSATAGQVAVVKTVAADVDPHPHFAGSHEGGGEKKYEERHSRQLQQYFDEIVSHIGRPDAVLLFGPGEAKQQLKERIERSKALSHAIVEVESADWLTQPQIVARVSEHFAVPH